MPNNGQRVEFVYDPTGFWPQSTNSVVSQEGLNSTKGAVLAVVGDVKGEAFTLIGNVLVPTTTQTSIALPTIRSKVHVGWIPMNFIHLKSHDQDFLTAGS